MEEEYEEQEEVKNTPQEITSPVIIFTTFWDCKNILDNLPYIFAVKDNVVYVINTKKTKDRNVMKFAISITSPPEFKDYSRLNMFAPTYRILSNYKKDKDWKKYRSEYVELLKKRKDEILKWNKALQVADNSLIFLCCWENTSCGANCHRRILYDCFNESAAFDDCILLYRDGNESKEHKKVEASLFSKYKGSVKLNSVSSFGNENDAQWFEKIIEMVDIPKY